jgi:hypothetical protein
VPASRQKATASPDRRKPNDNSRRGVINEPSTLQVPADIARRGRRKAAKYLAKLGLKLFPVAANEKRPAHAGWQDEATDDPAMLSRWFGRGDYNIGVACGPSRLIVVDCDVKNGRNGIAELEALAGDNAIDLDLTLSVRTPSGGRHWYWLAPDGECVADSAGKVAPGIDIRSRSGLVVAPGSVTPQGRYSFAADLPIAPAPPWLLDAIRAASTAREPAQPVVAVELDLPVNVALARGYLADAPASIEGSGGDDNAFRVACQVRDFGVTEETALNLMRGDWNARCAPSWSDDELAAKVANAYSYAQNGAGVSSFQNTIGADFDELPDEDADALGDAANDDDGAAVDWRKRVGLRTIGDCAAQATVVRQYVIKGVLAKGDFAVVFGQPGAGKSLIAPYLGMCITTGRPVFGRRTRKGAVLYIAAEDAAGMKQRLTALANAHGVDGDPGFYLLDSISDLRDKAQRRAVNAAIQELQPVAIIVDTLARAFPGVEENEASSMGEVVTACRAMTKTGAAVMLIHHTPKTDNKTPRGSGALNADLDMALHVEKRTTDGKVTGALTKNRNGSCDWPVEFRIAVHELGTDSDGDPITAAYAAELDGEAATRTATDQREQLDWSALNFIAHTPPSEFTNAVLGKALGVTRDRARGLVRKLGTAGWVNKPKRGKPIITPAGHAWLEQNGERLFGYEARGDDLAA